MTPEELRARALALHRAGQLAEAERLYTELLRENPADGEALHLKGVVAHQTGRHALAVELIGRSIGLRGGSAAAYSSLGAALTALGRSQEALASHESALALEPGLVEAHNGRGIALLQLQRTAEALESFERAIALKPDGVELYNNRGNVLRRLRRLPEALSSFERAIELKPSFPVAYNNRGLVLQALHRYEDASSSYQRALALQPDYADAHNNLGALQYELGRPGEALASWRRALELQPRMHGVHGNLSNALRDLERPEEALAESELAIREEPNSAVNHCNRGNALFDLARFAEALASYDRALELDPRFALAGFNKGLCLLLAGDMPRGLPLYEWRKRLDSYPRFATSSPPWRGEDISGRSLLVHADQALGDTIQFCRYARLAAQRGAQVVLAVQPQLRALLKDLGPAIRIVALGERPDPCDFHCALMSLPLAFGTTLADIPAGVPYLAAEPPRVARWGREVGESGFKVGIVWQGSRKRIDVGRSVPLEMFARLAGVPRVRLISLQRGAAALEQLRTAPRELRVELLGESFDEGPQAFLDSAAVMTHLDLIVSCDTAPAHLAGALGRPTWIALKHVPDWRWFRERTDCPWYPSVRLFRQSHRGDWQGVFAAMQAELAKLAGAAP